MSGNPQAWRFSLTLLMVLALTACVPIPVRVEPEVEEVTTLVPNPDLLVSAGPRRFLEDISDRIESRHPDIEVVDPIQFRDAAFPEGGWLLTDLLDPEKASGAIEETGVRFLAIVKDQGYSSTDGDGVMIPVVFGTLTAEDRSVFGALIVDLKAGEPLAYLSINAEGKVVGAYLTIYGLFLVPRTQHGAKTGVADAIADVVIRNSPPGNARIAVMAAETDQGNFLLIEDPDGKIRQSVQPIVN